MMCKNLIGALILVAGIFSFQAALAEEKLEPRVDYATDEDLKKFSKKFQETLEDMGTAAEVKECKSGLWMYPTSGRDASYGAICSVAVEDKTVSWFMCNDEMIGKFMLSTSPDDNYGWITEAMASTCPPGG